MDEFIQRPRPTGRARRRYELMARHPRTGIAGRTWLLGCRRLSGGDDLFRDGDMRIGRRKPTGTIQQSLRNTWRRDEDPIRPGL